MTSVIGAAHEAVVVPSPSCPTLFVPQQRTPPVVIKAQAYHQPTATSCAPLMKSADGGVGARSPIPATPPPQHRTPPVVVTAHVPKPPTATLLYFTYPGSLHVTDCLSVAQT